MCGKDSKLLLILEENLSGGYATPLSLLKRDSLDLILNRGTVFRSEDQKALFSFTANFLSKI